MNEEERLARLLNNHISGVNCPYCGKTFSSIRDLMIINGRGFGYVICDCDEYPLVHSILYIKKDIYKKNSLAVTCIKQRNYQEAVRLLIDGYTFLERAYLQYLYQLRLILPTSIHLIFFSLKLLNPYYKAWYTYIRDRPKRITYIMSQSLLTLSKKNEYVVDIGCGFSYFLKYISDKVHPRRIIGIDESFSILLFSSLYFSTLKNVLWLCHDINIGIPIKENSIDKIFGNDVFMYIYSKKLFISDIYRVLKKSGMGILCHVHNKISSNFTPGYGIDIPEMLKYTTDSQIYGIEDFRLYSCILNNAQVQLVSIRDLNPNSSSYTFVLSNQHRKSFALSPYQGLYIDPSILNSLDAKTEILHTNQV